MGKIYDVSSERKTLMMCEPHLIAFAHLMKNEAAAEGEDFIACTDGDTVWYGPDYTVMEFAERCYVYVHELMHGIFKHGDRALLKRIVTGMLYPSLWNYAGDAIINEGIDHNPAMPSGMFAHPKKFPPVLMETIHKAVAEALKLTGAKPPAGYDPKARRGLQIEIVYDWLVYCLDAVQNKRKSEGGGEGSGSKGGKGKPGEQMPGSTIIERMAEEPAWDLKEKIDQLREMLEKGVSPTKLIDQIEKAINESRMKIEQIVQGLKLAGSGQGSIILELAADLPPPVVPWNRILRKLIVSGLGVRMQDSYVRFGNNTRFGLATGARHVPFTPGTTIFTERPRILVVLDVSGSHVGMLPTCFSEIWSIAAMKGAVVDVLTFDDGVQQKITIANRKDFNKVMKAGLKGGGGTSLEGVFEEIATMRDPYKSVVVMTDGYLAAPKKKPKVGIAWLVTPGGNADFPYGEVIKLPEVLSAALDNSA